MHTIEHPLLRHLALRSTGVPIYVQLRDQLLHALGAGVAGPGDQMPTMREMAVALKVDLNTVRRAYDELERRGVITLQRGRGSFVAAPPPPLDLAAQDHRTDDLAKRTLALAAAEGVEAKALGLRILALAADALSISTSTSVSTSTREGLS
jgi:GntR family transcriptional regulator